MATLSFRRIEKTYYNGKNENKVVFDFNLEIADKEFIVFVGPSGCGKSTTLRMVAGLEEITGGELYIDDVLVNEVSPKERDIAMVFQNYALYPHMTVFDNMAFGLKLRKYPKEDINQRVHEAAEILGLTPYLKRKPKALSGGQRQRVALGRAIVRTPKVFLMDEPLSNLDAKLRVQMRSEIAKIHKRVGSTSIYVTHDQIEAMTMADRIVIMKDGYIQQIGTPKEVYNKPANVFVGGFIGSPAMNFIEGSVSKGYFTCNDAEGNVIFKLKLGKENTTLLNEYDGKNIILGIRPEDIYVAGDSSNQNPSNKFTLECDISELLGKELIVYSNIGNNRITISAKASYEIESGDKDEYTLDLNKLHFFDAETKNRIE
ncbi:MAG: sn-glycerol-3-phosphate ABC transporter ATP-binding protein UgpC [Bacilli bacterium]|nr:sn-glycerol-3-phosphate ABC transporter ATP-binding protein UgpC [Bacilli bacterium]